MREVPVAIGLSLAALAVIPASGHVLDQFVEASRLEMACDRVVVELDLTPGVELAPAVFVGINSNRDGKISEAEGRSHAAQVLADLVLEVDGQRLDLELASATYPAFEAMRAGTGTIRLRAVASTHTSVGALPRAAAGARHRRVPARVVPWRPGFSRRGGYRLR